MHLGEAAPEGRLSWGWVFPGRASEPGLDAEGFILYRGLGFDFALGEKPELGSAAAAENRL